MVPVSPVPVAETIVHSRVTIVEPAAMKRAGVKSAPVKPTESAAVKSAKSATAMKTPASAPAMGRGVGDVWLAERNSARQSSCSAPQSRSSPGLGSIYS